MLDGFNIAKSDAVILFSQAVRTNPRYPLALDFDLENLGREGVLEHDFSLRYELCPFYALKMLNFLLHRPLIQHIQSIGSSLRQPPPFQRNGLDRDGLVLHHGRDHRTASG
jgi:hypothetical protein